MVDGPGRCPVAERRRAPELPRSGGALRRGWLVAWRGSLPEGGRHVISRVYLSGSTSKSAGRGGWSVAFYRTNFRTRASRRRQRDGHVQLGHPERRIALLGVAL